MDPPARVSGYEAEISLGSVRASRFLHVSTLHRKRDTWFMSRLAEDQLETLPLDSWAELSAVVGRNNPGAGQENFPLVLTNKSGRTCTVHGFPGAAFVNASGGQLGPDPKRSSGSPTTVTLKPGQSAWAGLTFSNPEVSGAKTATPAALLITPPDERDSLKVTWTAGTVPVSGNASAVSLIPFSPGTGA